MCSKLEGESKGTHSSNCFWFGRQFWLLVCSWLVFLVERAATLVRCSSADTSCRKAAVKYFTRWALCMHAPVRMGIVVCGVTPYTSVLLSASVEWSQLSIYEQ